ncbi:MAG: methyltransferase domain-containing protein [Ekhidna sp.]|nr:methyltransferase domain-containing protein [Ekhidna sp.]MBC6409635.1 methyltransferase domain-containing protein [Ekhidna sp.]MBC6426704.1 methyltransferase domain-containing protein [Ekhidna sp.]
MKFIISFLLRKIPRKYLQLFSHIALRIVSIFYLGNKVECPVCESKFRKFLPYGRLKSRSNALCPGCLSLERHRLIWLYLKEKTDFFEAKDKMLHIAPELCFINRFESLKGSNYITADIESPLAKVKMDIHDIPFEEGTFDVIFCNHVLEHVRDDLKAMREIYRVLKTGGYAILQIPLCFPLPDQTIEDPGIEDPGKREELFGQKDHVRKYGKDYPDRLRGVGFTVKRNYVSDLEKAAIDKYALDATEILFVVNK